MIGRDKVPVSEKRGRRTYQAYGLCIRSVIRLPCPAPARPGPAEVEVVNGTVSFFSRVHRATGLKPNGAPWFQHARLPDGSHYLRWSELFEFLVAADGGRIVSRPLDGAGPGAFQAYLLSQVLSFVLLKRGIEPLHSTAVVIDGRAVGFLGDCGYGKSSLGAALLQAGHPLLTDDLLVLKEKGHSFSVYPGPPRIKLYPEIARRLLGERVTGTPMNNLTSKLIIPLDSQRSYRAPAPLNALYVLTRPAVGSARKKVTIRRLSQRRAFLELLKNTFNSIVIDPERLKRQFVLATRVASKVPIKLLSYPRTLTSLPSVREAILADLTR